jgi:hypothetical protein
MAWRAERKRKWLSKIAAAVYYILGSLTCRTVLCGSKHRNGIEEHPLMPHRPNSRNMMRNSKKAKLPKSPQTTSKSSQKSITKNLPKVKTEPRNGRTISTGSCKRSSPADPSVEHRQRSANPSQNRKFPNPRSRQTTWRSQRVYMLLYVPI